MDEVSCAAVLLNAELNGIAPPAGQLHPRLLTPVQSTWMERFLPLAHWLSRVRAATALAGNGVFQNTITLCNCRVAWLQLCNARAGRRGTTAHAKCRAGLYHMQFVLGEQSRCTTHTPALYVQSGIGLASIPL